MSAPAAKQSFADVLRAAAAADAPPAWKAPLLRRAALVSVVDRELFETVLANEMPGKPCATFEEWSALPEVAPMPGVDGGFYVRDESRSQLLSGWLDDRNGLRDFASRLLRYYHRASPLDRLPLEILGNPAKGLQKTKAMYDEADDASDLSTCEAILRVLRNRLRLFETQAPAVFDYVQVQEQYLRSRVQFVDDYARSSHYLARTAVTKEVEAFLAQKNRWMLQIHAKGGLGKTAFLRWLIATRLVVERPNKSRWSVARVDVDHVNRSIVAAWPCLLLLEAANQLDRQLTHDRGSTVFGSFLLSYGRLLSSITPPVTRDSEANAVPSLDLSAAQAQSIEAIFCGSLGSQGALLVLDTIEELVLHNPDAWLATLELLARVCDRCKGLKVIVSGRYDFRKRSEFKEWTRSPVANHGMTTMALPELKGTEALAYLTRLRKLKAAPDARNPRLLTHTNPFKLAALADRIGAGGTFTRKDVTELREEGVDYLIHRIIDRLTGNCELQWILRYVVVPNELTREVFVDVLIPHVKREAERLDRDKPHDNLPPGADAVNRSLSWQRCTGAFEVDRLWQALGNYAATSSWITMAGGRPKLQPELLVPMRYLLRTQAIYQDVHEDAARFFERKAQGNARDPASYIVEAVYHWFQARGVAAMADWRRLTRGPNATPSFVEQVTSSLLTGNYLDDHDRPLPHLGNQPILDEASLAAVHEQLAQTRALLALSKSDRPALIKRIAGHVRAIAAIERRTGRTLVVSERLAVCRAVMLWNDKRADEALALIGRTLTSSDINDADRVRLLIVQATLLARGNPSAAQECYAKAAALADRPDSPLSYDAVRARQGRLFFANGQLTTAAEAFADAAKAVKRRAGAPSLYLQYAGHVIEVLHQSARWSEIPRWIDEARAMGGDEGLSFGADQQRRLDFATYKFIEVDSSEPTGAVHAQWRAARMAAMLHESTVDAYRKAIQLYERDGALVASQSCAIDQVEYVVSSLGQLHQAKSFAARLEPTGSNWFRGQLVLIELARQKNRERARQMWKRTWDDTLTNKAGFFVGVRERAVGLTFALTGQLIPGSAARYLAKLLGQVQPSQARVVLLAPFEFWDPIRNKTIKDLPASFLNALPTLEDNDPDWLLRSLLLADALVFAGEGKRARALIGRAAADLPLDQPLLARRVMGGLRRAGVTPDASNVEAYLAAIKERCASYPNFVLAVHVEQAEWWIECGFPSHARATLAAYALPPGEPNQYHCRYLALQYRLADAASQTPARLRELRSLISKLGLHEEFVNLEPVEGSPSSGDMTHPRSVAAEPAFVEVRAHQLRVMDPVALDSLLIGLRPYKGEDAQYRNRLPQAIVDVLENRSSTERLERLLGDAAKASELLRQVVEVVPFETLGQGGADVGLLLSFEDDLMAAFPWQWVLRDRPLPFVGIITTNPPPVETVRWLQSTLSRLEAPLMVDGVAGPKTRRILEAYDHRHHVLEPGAATLSPAAKQRLRMQEPEPVLVVNGGYEIERSTRTGYGAFDIDLEKEWRVASSPNALIAVMREFSVNILASFAPRLIHIAMPVAQTESEIRLVSVSTRGSGEPTGWTPTLLAGQVRNALGPNACPTVVIDVPHTGSRAEAIRTLILRNQFAAQLAAIGQFSVLAMGTAGSQTPALLHTLIGLAGKGESLAAFAREATSIAPEAPPAIFSSDPTLPL